MHGVGFGELPYLVAEDLTSACGYSPDGKLLAVAVWSGVIDVYDTTTWSKVRRLRGHDGGSNDVTFSADSQRIVSAGKDKTARVWESNGGVEAVLVLEGHTSGLCGTSFSPCGKKVVSCSSDNTIRLWDAQTGECLLVLEGHTSVVRGVRFSADGRTLVSGSDDKTIRFWNAETGEPAAVWTSPVGAVGCLAYSPNGRWVATGHQYGDVLLWDTATGETSANLYGHTDNLTSVVFSSSSQWLASSASDRSVKLWDVSSRTLVATLNGHNGGVYKVDFSPSERQIASVGADKKVRLRDFNSNESMSSGLEAPSPQDQRVSIVALAYTLDGGAIYTIDDDLIIRRWDREALAAGGGGVGGGLFMSDLYTEDLEDMFFLWCAAFSPDRRQIAASFDEGPIRLASVQPGPDTAPATRLRGHLRAVTTMTYSSCGRWLLSACLDKAVRLWDLHEDGSAPGQGGHVFEISALAYSPCGTWIASGSMDETVRLWHRQSEEENTWSCVSVVRGFFGFIRDIAWNPVVPMEFVTACKDGSVRVWGVSPGVEGEGVSKGQAVEVRFLWGSDLGILCAADMKLEGVVGLDLMNRRLLVQRGAVEALEA
ncbi:WD40-repeat-containing domain protein [Linnemannia elongata]|nr:WD40-repeat-containing domain protein [Linnemannia elongata]